jgi:hypothetical protein
LTSPSGEPELTTDTATTPDWLVAGALFDLQEIKSKVEAYAREENFVTHYKGPSESNTKAKHARFVCARSGKPESQTKGKDEIKAHRNRTSDKCDCKWAINISRASAEDKWKISTTKLVHSGGCVPGKLQYHMQQKKKEGQVIPPKLLEKLLVVLEAMPSVTKAQLRECLTKHNYKGKLDALSLWNLRVRLHFMMEKSKITELTIEEVDSKHGLDAKTETRAKKSALHASMQHNVAVEITDYLAALKELNPDFTWGFSQDGESRLTGVWVQTPAQKQRYQHFGDHCYIDATEDTNTDNFPTFACVGVSPENKCRTFCLSITLNQTNAAAKWTLQKLKASSPEREVQSLFCDSAVLDETITDVYPSCQPISCQWHIRENIKNNFLMRKEFKEIQTFFEEKLFNAESIEVFENDAKIFREKYQFADNWFKYHYQRRHRWALPWLREKFTLGHTSSSLAESSHAAHKAWIPGEANNLLSYIKYALHYDNQKVEEDNQHLVRAEIHSDKLGFDSFLSDIFHQGYSQHSISKLAAEWRQVSSYRALKDPHGIYRVNRMGNDKIHAVNVRETSTSLLLSCDCAVKNGSVNTQQCGIPCRHALSKHSALSGSSRHCVHVPVLQVFSTQLLQNATLRTQILS